MDDHDHSSSPSASSSGGGDGSAFHTPDTASSDMRTTPLASISGKKRSAAFSPDGDDVAETAGGITGYLGRIVSSITPWKRSRTSLDQMSRSAIKSANRTANAADDDNEDRVDRGGDGINSSGAKLSKLNLEVKFDGGGGGGGGILKKPSWAQQQQQGEGSGQQQQPRQLQRLPISEPNGGNGRQEEAPSSSLPANKRVCILVGEVAGAGGDESMMDSTSLAANPSFAPSPHPGVWSNANNYGDGAHELRWHGRSPLNVSRDVRGRRATPAAQQRRSLNFSTAGSTPGLTRRMAAGKMKSSATDDSAGAGGGGRFVGATSTAITARAPNVAGDLYGNRQVNAENLSGANYFRVGPSSSRRSTATTGFETGGYRRRPINARMHRPMTRLLTAVYKPSPSNNVSGGGQKINSMMLTDSIVEQILADNRSKSLSLTSNGNSELGLFGGGVKATTTERQLACTFQEEEAMARASAATAVPRVRMNRILGTGQTGGRRGGQQHQQESPAITFTSSTTIGVFTNEFAPVVQAGSTTSNRNDSAASTIGTSALLFGKVTAAAPAQKKAVSFFQPPATSDTSTEVAAITTVAAAADEPYKVATLMPRSTSDGRVLTPCKSNISMEEGERIEQLLRSEEWNEKVANDSQGYDDSSVTTPRKVERKAKTQSTPYPGKKAAMSTPALLRKAESIANAMNANANSGATSVGGSAPATPGGAPFNFMSGGAAAFSMVPTPLAYKFDTKGAIATSSVKPPAPRAAASSSEFSDGTSLAGAAAADPPTTASGWGNLFKPKPGEWKCESCSVKNPKEVGKCLACETPKASDAVDNGGSVTDAGSKSVVKVSAGVIGAGGFSFGGAPSSSTGITTGSKPFMGTGASATPAKAKRDRDDGNDKVKASIGAGGFQFGTAASSTPAASSLSSGTSFASGGFSFSGPTATPANTPAKSKVKNESSTMPALPSAGFSAAVAAPESTAKTSSLVGFNFGAAVAAPAPATKTSSSVRFGASASGDEKKEDHVADSASGTGVFSSSAKKVGERTDTGASIPGFSFGVPPPAAVEAAAEKGASEPPSKKTMFSLGTAVGGTSSLRIPENGVLAPGTHGFSFGAGGSKSSDPVTVGEEEDAASSIKPALAFENTSSWSKPTDAAPAIAFGATRTTTESASSVTPGFVFGGQQAGASTTPAVPFAFGAGSTPAPAAEKKNGTLTNTSNTGFNFVSTPAPASTTYDGASAMTPAAPFSFGSSASQAPSTSGGATFSFGTGAPSSFTPAPSANGSSSSVSGFMFGAGSTPSAFGSTPAGFGNSSELTVAKPAPTTPATTFAFGAGLTPAASSTTGFGTTPSFGFGNTPQPAAPQVPSIPGTFGFGGNSVATPNPTSGFAGGNPSFAATPAFMGSAATPSTMGGGGGGGAFSIGTGGTAKKTPGGRRIVKARRPPGAR